MESTTARVNATGRWLGALAAGTLLSEASAQADEPGVWLEPCGAIWASGPPADPDDDTWVWEAGGLLSVNAIDYGPDNAKSDGLETEAAAPILHGRLGRELAVWLEADLDGEDTRHNLREAWIERAFDDRHWLRAGLQRVALGSEFATRPEDLPLVGLGFPASLDGRTDVGLAWDGYATRGMWYSLSATTGSGFDPDGNDRHDAQLAGRLVLLPDHDPGQGFEGYFGGLALSWMPANHDEVHLATPLEQTVFTTPEMNADGARFLHLELGHRSGGLRAGFESVNGRLKSAALPGGGSFTFDELTAWSAFMAINVTGDAPAWRRGGWAGYGPDDHARGQPLPVELALRYSNGDIDRDLFDLGFTTYDPSTQEVRTISAALSAYATPLTRVALQWTGVIADDALATFGGTNRDTSWALRLDQRF